MLYSCTHMATVGVKGLKTYLASLSGNALVLINVVALRRARLVLGWVTDCERINHLDM